MNYSIYIFGKLSSGYTQYPEDSSSIVLKNIYSHCKAPTQIVIHRDENLMYYCYTLIPQHILLEINLKY